ncbi:MAG: hypothetical protein ABIG11_05450, partial [bacterium]
RMKAKYNPKTPDEWANVVENEITWVAHPELYGAQVYYISSEEAALIRTYNGIMGRFADCTGKAAILQNMLKKDGFGSCEIVLGFPKLGQNMETSHAWIILHDKAGNSTELFHYENTKDLLYSGKVAPAQGLIGDHAAEFAEGGIGGIITNLIYRGLDLIKFKHKQKA